MTARHSRRRSTRSCCLAAPCLILAATCALAQTPAAAPGTVTLPLAEYDRLVDRAAHPPAPPSVAPLSSALSRADMALRADGDALRGTISVQGEVWREGAVLVPLLRGGTIVDATLAGAAVPLVADAGSVAAIVRGPAALSMALTWATELASEPGRAVAILPAVQAGTVHATIDLPGDNADVRIEPGIVDSRGAAGGRTRIGLTLEPGTPARLSWSSRDGGARAPREVRLVSETKSLVTIGENELRVGTLFDVTVTQGQADRLGVLLPEGFDVAGVTGASVEPEGVQGGMLRLAVRDAARRRHQFLLVLERAAGSDVVHGELSLPLLDGVQRETGEVALEAVGTVELSAPERQPLHRLDVSEVSGSLRSLARTPLLSAFRYQRRNEDRVPLAFDVKRFPDAPVLSAVAERADVTTLVTAAGRTLTEVNLTLRNRGQRFLKVDLPAGASLLSAEVAGEAVKPVEGADGSRVPLVRPGFQPTDAYGVSFVFVAAGNALEKKGTAALSLATIDVPVNVLQWELFIPEGYEVKRFEGDAMPQHLVGTSLPWPTGASTLQIGGRPPADSPIARLLAHLSSSDVGGYVVDEMGGALPGVEVTLTRDDGWTSSATTDGAGAFLVRNVPAGPLRVRTHILGFREASYPLQRPGGPPFRITLGVAAVTETVEVRAEPERVEQQQRQAPSPAAPVSQAASQNVLNLQRRVSGVLPVRIDIPRSGRSYVLVRPLVLQEPTTVRFEYKRR